MNNQPWPVSKPVTPVNTTPGTDSEMQVVLASLNNLVTQRRARRLPGRADQLFLE